MPLNIPQTLPAIEALKEENIFVKGFDANSKAEDRPLKIALLNLMPLKIPTEIDFVRVLSNSPLRIELDFMKLNSHVPKHTPASHMNAFYKSFNELKSNKYDGLIITGAPVEMMKFEEVTYWKELTEIFDWAHQTVNSTLYICWGAQAALYHFYGIPNHQMGSKTSGVFEHTIIDRTNPIFRGFDDLFYVPHSRYTEIRKEDIEKVKGLNILSESDEAGIYLLMARDGKDVFVTGHSEYADDTLNTEYKRDLGKGMEIDMPKNYYKDDNPDNEPIVRWRSNGTLFFSNWLNYFVSKKD